jgi:serine/threonine protein phosphatase 1
MLRVSEDWHIHHEVISGRVSRNSRNTVIRRPWASKPGESRRVPEGVRIYAIGDIHGRADLLDALLERIEADGARQPSSYAIEIYLGDYVDRGSASQSVLERLATDEHRHHRVFLKGNHDPFITDFIESPSVLEAWQHIGGLETLMSYGIRPTINADAATRSRLAADLDRVLPDSHRRFLGHLKSSFECGDFFFVHAGVRPGIALNKQRDEDLLWIRQDFLLCEDDFGKTIVHGHTPVLDPDIRPNRINIDTGAYATGRLTCLVLEGESLRFI